MGAGTAERIVELGGNVVIADVNEEAGQAKAKALGEQYHHEQAELKARWSSKESIDQLPSTFRGILFILKVILNVLDELRSCNCCR